MAANLNGGMLRLIASRHDDDDEAKNKIWGISVAVVLKSIINNDCVTVVLLQTRLSNECNMCNMIPVCMTYIVATILPRD